jgi:hypothetical protein
LERSSIPSLVLIIFASISRLEVVQLTVLAVAEKVRSIPLFSDRDCRSSRIWTSANFSRINVLPIPNEISAIIFAELVAKRASLCH